MDYNSAFKHFTWACALVIIIIAMATCTANNVQVCRTTGLQYDVLNGPFDKCTYIIEKAQ